MEQRRNARSRIIDVYKGMTIFAIVVLHIALVAKSDVGGEPVLPLQILYLGLIGFFIISGYFFRPGRGFRENMGRRVRILFAALLVCAVVLTLASFLWCLLWGQPTGTDDLVLGLQRAFGVERAFVDFEASVPWAVCGISLGYYFLWCILGAFVIFYAVADRIRDDWKLGALVVSVLMAFTVAYRELFDFTLPFYLNLAPIAAVFMVAGMYLAKLDLAGRMESGGFGDRRTLGLVAVCLVAAVALAFVFPPNIKFDWMYFGSYGGWSAVPYTLEALAMFVVLLFLALVLSRVPLLSEVFLRLGPHTMGILLLHGFVAKFMLAPFFTFGTDVALPAEFGGIARVAYAFAVLAVTYAICAYGPSVMGRLKGSGKTESG